jgi:hypothetical protein
MKRLLAGLIYTLGFSIAQAGEAQISLEDILLLTEHGVSDETIQVFLETREIGFVPDAEDIDKLLAAAVSEEVIRYILRQTATSSAPSYSYQTTTYADRYPPYYYTPYYSGSSFFLGYSSFPHDWHRNHYSGVHYTLPHHGAAHYLGYNDHAALYRGGQEVHTSRYGPGHNTTTGIRHSIAPSPGQHSAGRIGQHFGNEQSVSNSLGSPGHVVEKTVIQRSRHKPAHGGQRSIRHNTRSRTHSSGLSGGHGGGH